MANINNFGAKLWDGELCVSVIESDGKYVDAYIFYKDKNGYEHEICCVTGEQDDVLRELSILKGNEHDDTLSLIATRQIKPIEEE